MNECAIDSRLAAGTDKGAASDRHYLFLRGQFLVFAGYLMVITETFIAIRLGITPITVRDTAVLSAVVLGSSALMISAVFLKRNFTLTFEWSLFLLYVLIYLPSYCYWIYRLQELRILGLLSAVTAVTVVLTYTSMIQSLMMSFSTLACHFAVLYYAMVVNSQPGNLVEEIFISFCLVPSFFLISAGSFYVKRKSDETLFMKRELQKTNAVLNEANRLLKVRQSKAMTELDLAHDIQRSFFPSRIPENESWDIAFLSVPSSGVSGDFYDFYVSGDSLEGISLFDVSGHGVAPALLTILAKPVFFRNFKAAEGGDLGIMFEQSNSELMEQLEEVHSFITGMTLRFSGSIVEYVNAGHPDLVKRHSRTGEVEKISDRERKTKGHPVGISFCDSPYRSMKFSVERGDMLMLYSDCLLECRNERGEQFGESGLFDSFAAAEGESSREILESVVNSLYGFAGGCCIDDDMTVIILRKK